MKKIYYHSRRPGEYYVVFGFDLRVVLLVMLWVMLRKWITKSSDIKGG